MRRSVAGEKSASRLMPGRVSVAAQAGGTPLEVAPNAIGFTGHPGFKTAMAEDLVDILCSDYHFPAMPASFVKMLGLGMPAWRAVEVLSLNPARCLPYGRDEVSRAAAQANHLG